MRAFAFVALASVASAALFFLACSDDSTGTTPGGSTSGNSSSGSSGNNGGTDAGIVVPEGGRLATNGECVIFCKPYQSGKKIASLTRTIEGGGTAIPWTNPEGALQQDDQIATVILNDGEESEWLQVSDFDWSSVTDNLLTYGIEVELTRQSDDGGVEDNVLQVLIDGKQNDVRGKRVEGSWPRLQPGVHNYGQEEDTWGVNLEPADVKKSSFGVRIAARRRPGITAAPVKASVDTLRLAVCTCERGKFTR